MIIAIPFPFFEQLRILWRQHGQIQLAGLHLHRSDAVVWYDFKNNPVNMCASPKIVFIFYKRDRLSHIPALHLIRPCSYRMAEKVRFLHILAAQQMFRKYRHRHIIQKSHVRSRKPKSNRMRIHYRNLFHILIIRRVFRVIFRIHNRLDRKLHVLCRKRFSIVPSDIFFQFKRIGICFRIKFPSLCKTRNYLVISIVRGQSVKN